jgi:hypothetical protein
LRISGLEMAGLDALRIAAAHIAHERLAGIRVCPYIPGRAGVPALETDFAATDVLFQDNSVALRFNREGFGSIRASGNAGVVVAVPADHGNINDPFVPANVDP